MLTFTFLLLLALSSLGSFTTASAQTSPSNPVNIQVDRTIEIKNTGTVIINDTITLSTNPGENAALIRNFSLGFPYGYKPNLHYCFAYADSNPDAKLDLALDVGLGRIGFYGMNVALPSVNVSDGGSYSFTVVSLFSDLISATAQSTFNFTFPLYPSLNEEASRCNVTVVLLAGLTYATGSHNFTATTVGSSEILSYAHEGALESFSREPAWITFTAETTFLLVENNEMRREITIDTMGQIHVSDFYHITNKAAGEVTSISLGLPKGAYDVAAHDLMAPLSGVKANEGNATTYSNVTVTFRTAMEAGESEEFTVTYKLPREVYITPRGLSDLNLTFAFSERFSWVIRNLTVTVTLPEGANFVSELSSAEPAAVQKGVFRDEVTYALYNVTELNNLNFSIAYKHPVFWASFRPTILTGLVVAAVFGIALLWRAPRPTIPVIPVSPEVLRSFVDAYEERERISAQLETMERQVRKGRIPRRRYKLRRRTLEGRLSNLSRNLTDLKEKMQKSGPGYANMVRRIEVAETELEGLEGDIRRIEIRRRRGQISSEAYHRLLADYHRRREKARVTIDGMLLRLRTEIH